MNQEEIKAILPHRDNMLLVEEVYEEDGVAHGKYHVIRIEQKTNDSEVPVFKRYEDVVHRWRTTALGCIANGAGGCLLPL